MSVVVTILGCVLTAHMVATVVLLWKDYPPTGWRDGFELCCATLNCVFISALMWKGLAA